jgi:hypothetical protein
MLYRESAIFLEGATKVIIDHWIFAVNLYSLISTDTPLSHPPKDGILDMHRPMLGAGSRDPTRVQGGEGMSHQSVPIQVFCSYAPEDEALYQQLEKHLSLLQRQRLILSERKVEV